MSSTLLDHRNESGSTEWARLCDHVAGDRAVRVWATSDHDRPPVADLAVLDGLWETVHWIEDDDLPGSTHDAVLVGLLGQAQDEDRLAGRVVLQTMRCRRQVSP